MRVSSQVLGLLAGAALSGAVGASPANAQSTNSPAADWNGNYGFASTAGRNLQILQADIIEKKEAGYYESLGKTTLNVTNNNDNSTHIGQQSTAVGVINNSTNNVGVRDSANVWVGADNSAISNGCQDGTIRIDSMVAGHGAATCN